MSILRTLCLKLHSHHLNPTFILLDKTKITYIYIILFISCPFSIPQPFQSPMYAPRLTHYSAQNKAQLLDNGVKGKPVRSAQWLCCPEGGCCVDGCGSSILFVKRTMDHKTTDNTQMKATGHKTTMK